MMLAASNAKRFWSTFAKTESAAANNAAKTMSTGAAMTIPVSTPRSWRRRPSRGISRQSTSRPTSISPPPMLAMVAVTPART